MTKVKERPILFSGPMVRAILEGRKTQTRRPIKPQPPSWLTEGREPWNIHGNVWGFALAMGRARACQMENTIACPFGVPGDRLWVRETWSPSLETYVDGFPNEGLGRPVYYRSTDPRHEPFDGRWRPSIHMPRWASRLTLEVTEVRVERLQDISEDDAEAEGITYEQAFEFNDDGSPDYKLAFGWLWDSIYAKGGQGWDKSPWAWAVTFKVVS